MSNTISKKAYFVMPKTNGLTKYESATLYAIAYSSYRSNKKSICKTTQEELSKIGGISADTITRCTNKLGDYVEKRINLCDKKRFAIYTLKNDKPYMLINKYAFSKVIDGLSNWEIVFLLGLCSLRLNGSNKVKMSADEIRKELNFGIVYYNKFIKHFEDLGLIKVNDGIEICVNFFQAEEVDAVEAYLNEWEEALDKNNAVEVKNYKEALYNSQNGWEGISNPLNYLKNKRYADVKKVKINRTVTFSF